MVFFNYTTMQLTAKIVYYGPGLCGKTTNLQHIHKKIAPGSRGEMISLETEADRTLFFDLLPLDAGMIGGMRVRLQLYTVPGQVFYNATRKLVLKGVDGIVFVADSQSAMRQANLDSFHNLQANLAELDLSLDQLPLVFQYNKRDLRSIDSVDRLNEMLNIEEAPFFEAAAIQGVGVFETLKGISGVSLASIRTKVATKASRRRAPPEPAAPAAAGPPPFLLADPEAPATYELLADLVSEPGPTEEASMASARDEPSPAGPEPATGKGEIDIQEELENLRSLTAGAEEPPPLESPPDVTLRLEDLLGQDVARELRRQASVEVPAQLLKESKAMKIHVSFAGHGNEEVLKEALTVPLVDDGRLERLTLHLDLELKTKG